MRNDATALAWAKLQEDQARYRKESEATLLADRITAMNPLADWKKSRQVILDLLTK